LKYDIKMTDWSGEIKELDKLYVTFKGHLPDIVKEMEQLVRTDDPNVVMLYSRRCLEVIITDLCESELKRPRKTEPLKGIIDKLNSEEKVPSHIITSMMSLNSMANYGAHPKDFDPEQVKPVLNNLAIIIRWYLKYKDFQVVSKSEPKEEKPEYLSREESAKEAPRSKKKTSLLVAGIFLLIVLFIALRAFLSWMSQKNLEKRLDESANNQELKSVTIGNQVWMAENLKTTKFNDGTPIPQVKDGEEWQHLKTPAYCWYNNDRRSYQEVYGTLYNWYAVNTGKLCPVGWHVPSATEWITLIHFLGDTISWEKDVAGLKLKEAGNEHWTYNDTIFSTNQYGFTALPGGNRNVYGPFWGIGEEGCWWSSTEDDYNKGDGRNIEMYFNQNNVTDIEQYKQFGMSVRCIKD
jgi:uncharacterized protein (TIGR02145 family)